MKNLLIIAAFVSIMAACTKSSVSYEETGVIAFCPVAEAPQNKSVTGPMGIVYDQKESFKVFAYHKARPSAGENWSSFFGTGTGADKGAVYIQDGQFSYSAQYSNWSGVPKPYYWPKTGYLMFAGYSPASLTASSVVYDFSANPTMSINGFEQGSYNVDQMQTKMVDLMWFNVNDAASKSVNNSTLPNAPVPVKFHHSLSWLTFNFLSVAGGEKFFLTEAILSGVNSKADFTGNVAGASWSAHSVPVNYVLHRNPVGTELSATALKADNLLVIPYDFAVAMTGNYALTLKFRQGDNNQLEQSVTFQLKSQAQKRWDAGIHYTYNITISANPIILEPSVDAWNEITGGGITVN